MTTLRRRLAGLGAFGGIAALIPFAFATFATFAGCGTVGEVTAYPPSFGDDGTGAGLDGGGADADGGCDHLECQKVKCANGGITRITGTVVTPAITSPDPVYNALAFVPNRPLAPFTQGPSCAQCGAPPDGKPIAQGVSRYDGTFTIDDAPAGDNIPIVVQVGKWRRQAVIPHVEACATTAIPTELTRLPRNHAEGDIPYTAIVTGGVDPVECTLRKMGIDDSEFDLPSGQGRLRFYKQNGANVFPAAPPGDALWSDPAELAKYDFVMLPCEGLEYPRDPKYQQNLADYADHGGRIFATHYGFDWIRDAPEFSSSATWLTQEQAMANPVDVYVDRTFPKGAAFADWLALVGASFDDGRTISVNDARHDANEVRNGAQRWLYTLPETISSLQHYSFNTPIGRPAAQQCGRVVFSDFHVALSAAFDRTFPDECTGRVLAPQERVLEFMLFDVLSCIQEETADPTAPPPTTP